VAPGKLPGRHSMEFDARIGSPDEHLRQAVEHHPCVPVEGELIHLATMGRLSALSGAWRASHGAGVRAPVD
jgi:hypothetical protein